MPKNKILIVDDNISNIEYLLAILEDGNYEVAKAYSGEEALTIASTFLPNIILLDIMMPGIDGYEVCQRIRETPFLKHVIVIMTSAKALVSEKLKGYRAGADDYITKPFDDEELLAKLAVYQRLRHIEE